MFDGFFSHSAVRKHLQQPFTGFFNRFFTGIGLFKKDFKFEKPAKRLNKGNFRGNRRAGFA